MKNKERIIEAGYVYDLPKLVFSEEEKRIVAGGGEVRKESFRISASDGSVIRGKVLSQNYRIHLLTTEFHGSDCEISFLVITRGLLPGQSIRGSILVSSNIAEKNFAVYAEIVELPASGEESEIRTLDDFSRLCQKSLREGFLMFTNPDFSRILNGNNRQYLGLYRGMSHNPVTYQHLEEFLVSTGKKEPIAITLDKQQKAVYHLDVSQKDTLYVYRNVWGYVRLEVEVEGDFLEVNKRVITTEDFIGKVYGLEYIVHSDRLGEGKSFGKIRIRSVHQVLEYIVEASRKEESEILPSAVRSRKIAWLMRDFLNLQLHTLDYRTWLESSSLTVHEMLEENPGDCTAILYAAYLEFSREDNAKAMECLWPVKDGKIVPADDEERGIYLSLAKDVGLLPEEKRDILPLLQKYYRRNPGSYPLLKLVQQEANTGLSSSADRMQELEDCFSAGCTSPFLYLDAWNLLAREESLLRRLSSFMIQVLHFGLKHDFITEGILQRTAFLSDNEKNFNRPLYRILTAGYRKYPNDAVLEAICKLLIKGNPVDAMCFPWYEKAVLRDLRITRLYEYYMETYHKPASEKLPQQILMYFATNPDLAERKRALLYASIVLNRKEDDTSFLNYGRYIRSFAMDALRKGRMDENYAILYEQFFRKPETPEIARLLGNVLFVHKVTVSDPMIRRVVVSHYALKEEETALVRDGVAYPRIYTDDAAVLMEDTRHRRYATTIPFRIERLMDERESARGILEQGVSHPGAELSICREKPFQMDVNSRSVFAYRMAAQDDAFTDTYRMILRRKLMEYDMAHPAENIFPRDMGEDELNAYAEADKVRLIILLIRDGRYKEAFHVISEFGCEGVPTGLLLRLSSRLILGEEADSERLLQLTEYVFEKGKYDEVMLSYLRDHWQGSVHGLVRLWEKLRGFQMETLKLDEKILLQSIDTHQFPDHGAQILKDYVRKQGRQEVVAAFFAYLSDYYFLGNREMDPSVFVLMEQAMDRGELNDTVCSLALLQYYSTLDQLDDAQMERARVLLKQMDEKGLRFEFFSRLPKKLVQACQIEDKIFVQEQFHPDSRVILHYKLTEQNGGHTEWVSEPMKNVYRGIFVREFLLFYGETLRYYMSVMTDGQIRDTDTYEVSLVDMDTSGNTKYRLINHMLEERDRGDRQGFEQTMEKYLRQEYFVSRFLRLAD
ncbi:MAG: DUF5717 family protein [Bilifractor sp.]